MQVNLRRFIHLDTFGRFLGLMQSEGTKTNFSVLEFANKSISEHEFFINFLSYLGIEREMISMNCVYYSGDKDAQRVISEFEKLTRKKLDHIYQRPTSKYGTGFILRVRSVVLANIILFAMDKLRNVVVHKKWDDEIRIFANGFFAKLLSGDGNIDLDTKERIWPQGRIKITDKNINYLKDYKIIMEKFGLKPKLNERYIIVRSYFNLEDAKMLLKIKAFENNPNEKKLEFFIKSREPTK